MPQHAPIDLLKSADQHATAVDEASAEVFVRSFDAANHGYHKDVVLATVELVLYPSLHVLRVRDVASNADLLTETVARYHYDPESQVLLVKTAPSRIGLSAVYRFDGIVERTDAYALACFHRDNGDDYLEPDEVAAQFAIS